MSTRLAVHTYQPVVPNLLDTRLPAPYHVLPPGRIKSHDRQSLLHTHRHAHNPQQVISFYHKRESEETKISLIPPAGRNQSVRTCAPRPVVLGVDRRSIRS
jgi:hypothetical protein